MERGKYMPSYDFTPWLNERTGDDDTRAWEELGLKPNAPKKAVKAYNEFREAANAARANGEKI